MPSDDSGPTCQPGPQGGLFALLGIAPKEPNDEGFRLLTTGEAKRRCPLHPVLRSPEARVTSGPALYGELIGVSEAMRRVFALLIRLEKSLAGVLVQGESGTGKELVARAIHRHSSVKSGPFVAINCGALDRALVRSELLGCRKGAFTGANESRAGAFESANGGTLFLDEVGELPLDVQPVLLRVLELGAVARMGETEERPVNVRLIAATNRDLRAEVSAGRFREDLFFRLQVVTVALPPLRQRPEDIDVLALAFAERLGVVLDAELLRELRRRPWRGNARELKNALIALSVLGSLPPVPDSEANALGIALAEFADVEIPYVQQKEALVERFTKHYLCQLMVRTRGNKSQAARLAGLQRGYLSRLLAKHSGHSL